MLSWSIDRTSNEKMQRQTATHAYSIRSTVELMLAAKPMQSLYRLYYRSILVCYRLLRLYAISVRASVIVYDCIPCIKIGLQRIAICLAPASLYVTCLNISLSIEKTSHGRNLFLCRPQDTVTGSNYASHVRVL